MHKILSLIGAGGHARSVIALLQENAYTINSIFDSSWKEGENEKIMNIPLVGNIDQIPNNIQLCLAIGNNTIREELFNKWNKNIILENIIHSTAYVHNTVQLKNSNLIFGKAFINTMATLGSNNIINTGAVIEHETSIGNNNHISVSSTICGRVKIGNNCFVGAGAVIKDYVSIGNNITIGAGAVVVKNIIEPGIYVGNPSKKIK